MKRIALAASGWLAVITLAHMALNVDWNVMLNDRMPVEKRKLNVAFIPVT
ncbi:MAG: hypothetical protein JJE51_01415 [Thermoanaerobaculia bacterium]|nr:hypothetical protein [Thermoanaerobaculia bacterium]